MIMTRLDKYNKLVDRLASAENYDLRPGAIWTDDEINIAKQRDLLKNYLEIISQSAGDIQATAEYEFDKLYNVLWAKLDKLGWK